MACKIRRYQSRIAQKSVVYCLVVELGAAEGNIADRADRVKNLDEKGNWVLSQSPPRPLRGENAEDKAAHLVPSVYVLTLSRR